MTDEGYNVEWSQELTLEQSAQEYVTAWAIVHLLPRVLGWDTGGIQRARWVTAASGASEPRAADSSGAAGAVGAATALEHSPAPSST